MGIKQKAIDLAKQRVLGTTVHHGRQLRSDLGLNKIKYVWIRKIINISLTTYIITYDSRYPSTYLPRFKIKNPLSSSFRQLKKVGGKNVFKDFKFTPAIDLNEFDVRIDSAHIIVQDLAGEKFIDKKLFECRNGKLNLLERLNETI